VARLARFFYRHSRGAFGEAHADRILAAARASLHLWDDDLCFADLAEDIAVEARLALALTAEIKELDERIALLVRDRDPPRHHHLRTRRRRDHRRGHPWPTR
jgi:hypothetical protein